MGEVSIMFHAKISTVKFLITPPVVNVMNAISTLGSHCALQVLKGAKDEGLKTLLVCEKRREELYRRFRFIDEVIIVDKFQEILDQKVLNILRENNAILVPHGTLISSMNSNQIESLNVPFFGNRWILRWEADRKLKEQLIIESKLETPSSVRSPADINGLVIVKLHGAAGGRGYFLAWDNKSFIEGADNLKKEGLIKTQNELYIQEYVFGVPVYLQYFYSPLSEEIEFMGIDRRYESDIDGLGRISSKHQQQVDINPSFTVVGNIPIVLRESLLDEVFKMGERFVEASKKLVKPGMVGPFCIEGVYDKEGKFVTFEFSARIVAGTNLYVDGSPYTSLHYDEPMSTGRRLAREVKIANNSDSLEKIVT